VYIFTNKRILLRMQNMQQKSLRHFIIYMC